jgi:hypothetical protein
MTPTDTDLSVLNSPRHIAARDAWMRKLQGLFDGQDVPGVFDLNGYMGVWKSSILKDPKRWLDEVLADLAAHADLIVDQNQFRPLVVRTKMYQVHFIDAILGAAVFDLDGNNNWQAHPLKTPVGALRPPDLKNNPTWNLAQQVAQDFLSRRLALPIYEIPTLSSPLNIALNLYGEEFLIALLDDPPAARHDLRVITDLIVTLHRWYIAHIPTPQRQPVTTPERCQPPGFGQICGCSTHVLSGQQYADFIAPLDEEILATHPHGGMIHLCGAHAQHIPAFRSMRHLRAVQVNNRAADDLPAFFTGLREDQILYVNLYPGMPWKRVLEITGGRRLVTIGKRDGGLKKNG